MSRAREVLTIGLTRSQIRLLEAAGRELLRDVKRVPRGPERRSLMVAVDRLRDARDVEAETRG